ncbi:hypothetical protein PJL18_03521 [Paenarthrobacter nicotinovorans]|nr:hypothetical protein [Paenarthrobacter nicotinovorans]
MAQQGAGNFRSSNRALVLRVKQLAVDAKAARLPVGHADDLGQSTRRRIAPPPFSGRGFHESARDHRQGERVFCVEANIRDPEFDSWMAPGKAGVEVDHALVHGNSGAQQRPQDCAVSIGRTKYVHGTGSRPPVPDLCSIAREAGVGPHPEGRVGAEGKQHGEPVPHAVQDSNAFLRRLDGYVDMKTACELLTRNQAEFRAHGSVALIAQGGRRMEYRRGSQRGHPRTHGSGRLVGQGPAGTDFSPELSSRPARPGVDFDLLLLEFGLQGSGVAVNIPAVGSRHVQNVCGEGQWHAVRRIGNQKFLLDTKRAHRPTPPAMDYSETVVTQRGAEPPFGNHNGNAGPGSASRPQGDWGFQDLLCSGGPQSRVR